MQLRRRGGEKGEGMGKGRAEGEKEREEEAGGMRMACIDCSK